MKIFLMEIFLILKKVIIDSLQTELDSITLSGCSDI
ncbi:MAG: hypothetical protein CM15mP23_06800 [Cryomorphaceae bacterium]|nr:MAG: hypothetical protein CM15mP23_06800 [Cryomorphaceae bacterium]